MTAAAWNAEWPVGTLVEVNDGGLMRLLRTVTTAVDDPECGRTLVMLYGVPEPVDVRVLRPVVRP